MKLKKLFLLRLLTLLSIITATSIFTYTMLTRRHQLEANGQANNQSIHLASTNALSSAPHATQPQAPVNNIIFKAPENFASVIVREVKLKTSEKYIALTFDDGPWHGSTDEILNILHKNNIKATFFMIGQNVEKFPQQGKNILADGHAIGNHTWHHWYMHMSPQLAASEINSTADVIEKTLGAKTNLFRPPGGILNNGLVEYAKNQNDAIILWSADSEDYRVPSVATLIKRVMKQAAPGGIVLMHDGGGNRSHTVAALPQIISKLRQQGYKFVTVPELLELQNKEDAIVGVNK